MKIGIITVYDAVNYGSYLQAYALKEVLKNISNVEPKMIKGKSLLYEKWRFTSTHTYKVNKYAFKAALRKKYKDAWKKFKKGNSIEHYDLIVIGSDEMWELHNITMTPQKIFFGAGLHSKRLITYAVSSNGTSKQDVAALSWAVAGLKNFDAVGIRDHRTKHSFEDFLSVEPILTLDPTLLIDLDSLAVHPLLEDYILVYSYSLREKMVHAIKCLSLDLRKPIVVIGQQFDWADYCVPASPFEFLGFIKNAAFVVTDTFHGVTLSIGLRKNFVCDAYKAKVAGALEFFGLEDRDYNTKKSMLSYYDSPVQYQIIEPILNTYKELSLDYLSREVCFTEKEISNSCANAV